MEKKNCDEFSLMMGNRPENKTINAIQNKTKTINPIISINFEPNYDEQ